MTQPRPYFDLAIVETNNGGDIQLNGQDLAIVRSHENDVYLALFGGNVEGVTALVSIEAEMVDYWANQLLFQAEGDKQYNSITEKTLNTVALSSAGRLKIENAVKEDLKFLSDAGAEVNVEVSIPSTNTVQIKVEVQYNEEDQALTIITLRRNEGGDFSIVDFSTDFY